MDPIEFLKQRRATAKKKGKLKGLQPLIRHLVALDYDAADVVAYLEQAEKLTVTAGSVRRFILRHGISSREQDTTVSEVSLAITSHQVRQPSSLSDQERSARDDPDPPFSNVAMKPPVFQSAGAEIRRYDPEVKAINTKRPWVKKDIPRIDFNSPEFQREQELDVERISSTENRKED